MNIIFNTVSKLFTPKTETQLADNLVPVFVEEASHIHLPPSQPDSVAFTHFMAASQEERDAAARKRAADEYFGQNNPSNEVIGIVFNDDAKTREELWEATETNKHGEYTSQPIEEDDGFFGQFFGKKTK
jgi:hypothetical protein